MDRRWWSLGCLGCVCIACVGVVWGADAAPVGPTRVAAARFLEQAAFGPTREEIDHVQALGFSAWLDEQFAARSSYIPPLSPSQTGVLPLQQVFFTNAINGKDQLRLRVALALHEIWVVSANKIGNSSGMALYLRLLQSSAFGNYYDLMHDMTLNPAMGNYLDMANNDKPNAVTGHAADENYARELMQLFTIGLVELNLDGTPKLDKDGKPIPTYDQAVVEGFARALTGWTYAPPPGRPPQFPMWENYGGPMVPVDAHHDFQAKPLLRGVVAPAGQTAAQDLDQALHNVFEHPNVAPFVSKQLIQHLVISNPSPAYVERVATVFNDDGKGTRGNLQAVVRAILLDPEARQGDDPTAAPAPGAGKLKEPIVLAAALVRAAGVTMESPNRLIEYTTYLGQNLYVPDSVFSYFVPGTPVDSDGTMGPEFQLLSPTTAVFRANFIMELTSNWMKGLPLDWSYWIGYSDDPPKLVSAVAEVLCHGALPSATAAAITAAVEAQDNRLIRICTALYLVAVSAESQVQH